MEITSSNSIQPEEYSTGGVLEDTTHNLRNPDGNLYVGYLYQDDDGRWHLNFNWLDNDWNSHDQFACRDSLRSLVLIGGSFFFK